MKPFLLALILSSATFLHAADAPVTTFYVQLIRGSDVDAPESQARLIGPKLDRRLHDVFKWKNYWEVKRETVNVQAGSKVRRRMTDDREIEIALTSPKDMEVCIYTRGKLTRKRQQSVDTSFYIAGGDSNATQSWFIVVRKDNPDAMQDTGTKLAAMP